MSTVEETRLEELEGIESTDKPARLWFGPGPRRYRWNADQYMRLAMCDFFRGEHVELIEGEIIRKSPIGTSHAVVVTMLTQLLETIFAPAQHVRSQQQFDLGPRNQPEPDLAVVPGKPRDYRSGHPKTALLIVEVSESSLQYDLGLKAELYAKGGIADYWVVDLNNHRLIVHRQPEPDLSQPGEFHYAEITTVPADGSVSPLAKPEAKLAVADLLP